MTNIENMLKYAYHKYANFKETEMFQVNDGIKTYDVKWIEKLEHLFGESERCYYINVLYEYDRQTIRRVYQS